MFISDQFEVLELLGKGGNGSVYKAKHLLSDRIVAIKVLNESLRSDESRLRKFQREAKTTSSLDHPHIVKVFAFGLNNEGCPYFAMEYLDGKTLDQFLNEKGSLNDLEFNEIFVQVCSALEFAHERGVIHRDLKPENIMVMHNDSGDREVKLLDFGLASQPENASGHNTTIIDPAKLIGSPLFMSPEQCQGRKPDARSDIYALACIMYQALSGRPPFTGTTTHEILLKQLHEQPLDLANSNKPINPVLNRTILRCLEKKPENRFQSVSLIHKQLPAALEAKPQSKKTRSYLNKRVVTLALVMPLALILVSVLALQKRSPSPQTKSERPKANFAQLSRDLKEAKVLDSDGQNDEAVAAYELLIEKASQYHYPDDTPTAEKLARFKYDCYRGIIHARVHSEDCIGQVALKDWELCYAAALKAYPRGDRLVAEAQSRLAFELTLNGPRPGDEAKILQLCRKANRTMSIELAESGSAPVLKIKSTSLTKNTYADSNIVIGRLRDLKGEHLDAAAVISEWIEYRGSKVDERLLFERLWLIQALYNSRKEGALTAELSNLSEELNSEPKIHPQVRLRVLDSLLHFFFHSSPPQRCRGIIWLALERLNKQNADPGQIALCDYYNALLEKKMKRQREAQQLVRQAQAELAKSRHAPPDLSKKLRDLASEK